jgi:DNA-binding transcriptional ArsR family regulator
MTVFYMTKCYNMSMENQALRVLKLLANELRWAILLALRDGDKTVGDLVTLLDVEQSRVSHQLKAMRECQLVRAQRRGKFVVYAIGDPHITGLMEDVIHHAEHVARNVWHEEEE